MSDAAVIPEEPPAEPPVEPPEPVAEPPAPIAAGGDPPAEPPEPAPYWPEDWRQKMADHAGAGDPKAVKKELKRLERFTDPTAVYGFGREAESKLTSGGLLKMPGKDATPEAIAEFHKALGVPEKAEDYFKDLELENGAVIGEADKPLVDAFAAKLHEAGAPPSVMNAALNWYYGNLEEQAADLDESDDKFRHESERALKDEMGPAYRRNTNGIASLFATAPGGTDLDNEGGLYGQLMGGRLANGNIIGNDPDMVRFLVGLAHEINPAASVVEDGDQTGKTIDDELAEISKFRREDRAAYNKDERMQARERELFDAQERIQARA